ncbi:MAG: hypothetical protein JO048_14815 [Methylobacteriaceae bacterium]|nr:hypothetical protein [Methylobacteriaceae bacterium]
MAEPAAASPRLTVVPADAIVVLRPAPSRGGLVPRVLARREAGANDNAPLRRSLWRELFFLTLLAVTLYAFYYSGQMHAFQRVIVVPEPSQPRSVIT